MFATLSALPLKPRLTPEDVHRIVTESVLSRFTAIGLGEAEYREAMTLVALRNLASGSVYDALPLAGARSAGCEQLFTLNLRHFQALVADDDLVSGP